MRRSKLWNRTISFVLAGTMMCSLLPSMSVFAAEDTAKKELVLSFEDNLTDDAKKNTGIICYGADGKEKVPTYVEGINGKALALDGATYLDLGTAEGLQPKDMTLSFWTKATQKLNGEHIIMWNKPSGKWDGAGWYLSCLNDSVPLRLSIGASNEKLTEFSVYGSRDDFFPIGEWVNIVITCDSQTGNVIFYRNGEKLASDPASSEARIKSNTTDHKYLGFNSPGYGGGYANLQMDEYEIYSSVASAEEVSAMYERYAIHLTDEEIVEKDWNALDPFAGKNLSAIKSSVTLPTQGKNGSVITWKSSNPAVFAENGKVTRDKEQDVEVTVTATVTSNGVSREKSYTLKVLKAEEIQGVVNQYHAYKEDQFALNEVLIEDEYYKHAQDADIAFLKKFDNDRILAGFRENAGIDKKGAARYNGWENSLLAGHCIGHYLSAAAQAVLATGDEELAIKLEDIISGLKECQDQAGSYGNSKPGFLFGANVEDPNNVEKQFDIVQGNAQGNTWVPWYNMHKVIQGLVDTYKYTGNQEALEVASNLGDWVYNRVSKWSADQQKQVSWTEYGGMNDCMYELYKLTNKPEHKEAAHKFDDPDLYKVILSGNADTLKGRHANTTIPKFVGALNRYVALKEVENVEEKDYLKYAEDFWTLVVEKHCFITGGTSDMEHFRGDSQLDEIRTQCNCESCCAHNMLKLSKELYKVTGKKKYADYYESTLRNAIMGAINEEGAFSYFTPMATGYYKFFGTSNPDTNQYWCCTGTGMENYTKLGDSIYFKDADSIYVNQYIASTVNWSEKGITLTQEADVTKSDKATFTLHTKDAASVAAKLKLRIPDWVRGVSSVKVNGENAIYATEDEYIVLEREWKDGDKVEYTYPMEVVAYGLPDNKSVFAFKYGPTVLAAKLGTEEWNDLVWAGANLSAPAYKVVGSEKARLQVSYGKTVKQILGTETISIQGDESTAEFMKNINNNLKKTDGKMEFKFVGTDSETVFGKDGLVFVPFNTLNNNRYGIYWYFESKEDSSAEKILAEKEEGRFAASIVDSIQPGYQQYENDATHQMKESNSVFETGVSGLGSTRAANKDGYFEYNMKVDKTKANSLLCQFAKADEGKKIKITVGSTVFQYTVEKSDDILYKKYFEIPAEEIAKASKLTVGNETYDIVKVRFESADGNVSARVVNGLFMTRAYDKNAGITKMEPSEGRMKNTGNHYTIQIPKNSEKVTVNFTLTDTSGLLYIDDILVNEAKPQVFNVKEGTNSYKLKAFAQDHTTSVEYELDIVRADGLDAGEEIIVNGDIENGTNAWVSNANATLGLGYSTVHSGALSLKMSERTSAKAGAKQDITGKVKAGATYELDGYVVFKQGAGHNDNPPAKANISFSLLLGNDEKQVVMMKKEVKLDEWTEMYGDFTVPADADTSKVSFLISADENITFFADDVSMKMLKTSEVPSEKPSETPSEKPSETPSQKPSQTPSQKPSVKPSTKPSVKPSQKPSIVKNKVYTVSGYKYKVTDTKKKRVTVVGVTSKKMKTISIKDTVVINKTKCSITAVGSSAFKDCKKATSVTIGKNVTSIGSKAFYNCSNASKLTINSKVLRSVGSKAFKGWKKNMKTKFPSSKKKTYEKMIKKAK